MAITEQSVGELVAERPGRSRVFEELGIDYCCGGRLPLAEACALRGLDAADVRRRLDEADAGPADAETDWTTAPLADLCDHIVTTHHDRLRRDLPRIWQLLAKVVKAYGQRCPELNDALRVFSVFADDLTRHMAEEEHVLFPLVKGIEAGVEPPTPDVRHPIRVMEVDHDEAGAALAELRRLTGGYAVPPGGCNTYRAVMAALAELEVDMHTHVHKENHIMFPRAERLVADALVAR